MISLAPHDGLPLDLVEACLLLALAERPAYGYELKRELDDLGFDLPDRGRIYRGLRAMEARGLVVSHWDVNASGPARRTYVLTPLGHGHLDGQARAVRDRRRQLSRFLSRFERLGPARHGAVA